MRSPFTTEEHERIHAAIEAAERRTSADLDIAVTRVSDRYSMFPIAWAAGGALTTGVIVALLWPEIRVRSAIVIQVVVLIALTAAFDWLPIRIALVPDSLKRARAHQLARREFAASIDADGARRHRILLFVSLAEHYVEIIADRETHMLVAEGTWDKIVADFVAAVKRSRVFDGVMCAIEGCAGVLETHHPQPGETRV